MDSNGWLFLKRAEHKLFIGMLPKNVSEDEVSGLFSQYGTIKDLQILRGSQQTSKGSFRFVSAWFSWSYERYHTFSWIFTISSICCSSSGCAFLKYETKDQAVAALEAINGKCKMEVMKFSWYFRKKIGGSYQNHLNHRKPLYCWKSIFTLLIFCAFVGTSIISRHFNDISEKRYCLLLLCWTLFVGFIIIIIIWRLKSF